MSKLEEMEKLAKSEVKLKGDFEKFAPRIVMILQNAVENETDIIKRYK